MLDKGTIHIPGGTEDSVRCHHAPEKGMQLKIDELLISGIFQLIFSCLSWPRITETMDRETVVKGG